MKNIKNKKALGFLIATIFVGIIGVTYAIFQKSMNITNRFNTAEYNVKIDEEFNPSTWPGVTTKKVSVNNEGTAPVLVRVSYNEIWKYNGNIINNLVNGQNVVIKNWVSTFNTDWTYKDGWYYYKKVLPGKSSVQILESIKLNDSIATMEYQNGEYELIFNYEAVQATKEAEKELWGHDITISGTTVSWGF